MRFVEFPLHSQGEGPGGAPVFWLLALLAATALPGCGGPAQDASLAAPERELFQQDLAWSPDGQWLAFSEYSGGADYQPSKWAIELIRLDGSQRRRLTDNALYVTWSPDGGRLAFGAEQEGNWDVYIRNLDGSGPQRLTRHESEDGQPAWSPLGDRIAFTSERDGNREIYSVAADGSELERLTNDPAEDYNPSWSPDGKTLVFYREKGDGRDQIVAIAADGSGEWSVTRDERHNIFPSFLPDGRIGFVSSLQGGTEELVVSEPDGSGRQRIGDVSCFFARWSPDGGSIAFISGAGWPRSAIYLMRADGTGIRKIVN